MTPFSPSSVKIIEEEMLVGVETASAADQPWVAAARLDEVLRVCVRCYDMDAEAFRPVLHKVIHPMIRVYTELLAMTENDPLVWGNLQLGVRLLREEKVHLKKPHRYRSAIFLLEKFRALSASKPEFAQVDSIGSLPLGQRTIEMIRIQLASPSEDPAEKIQVAVLAGLHGNEAEGIYAIYRWINEIFHRPSLLKFYTFHLYPMLNPHGFEYASQENANGVDLRKSLHQTTREIESQIIKKEFQNRPVDGVIDLQADENSIGLYGYANGSLLSQELLKPALLAASTIIPINLNTLINGHRSEGGIIKESIVGSLHGWTPLSSTGHEPFTVILQTPNLLSLVSRATAHILMLRTLIDEHRRFISQSIHL